MTIYVYYEKHGDVVTEFNYEEEMKLFLKRYNELVKWNELSSMSKRYCTELGIQMVRILIIRQLIPYKDVVFCYEGQALRPDKDANVEPWPEGFCDKTLKVLQELVNVQMENWKNHSLPKPTPVLKWGKPENPESSAILESKPTLDGTYYQILPNQQRLDIPPKGFIVSRNHDEIMLEGGYIGEHNGQVGICCGFATFCAIGAPSNCVRETIEELQALAENDLLNLQVGKNLVFIQLLAVPEVIKNHPDEK